MARNNETKEVDMKTHTCYYFDDIINIIIYPLTFFYIQ